MTVDLIIFKNGFSDLTKEKKGQIGQEKTL